MPRSDHGTSSVSEARGRKSAPRSIPVAITATLLAPVNGNRVNFLVHNAEASVAIYLGSDATVTPANGVPLAAGGVFEDNTSYDEWWAIVTAIAGAADVRVIITTLDA